MEAAQNENSLKYSIQLDAGKLGWVGLNRLSRLRSRRLSGGAEFVHPWNACPLAFRASGGTNCVRFINCFLSVEIGTLFVELN